MKVEAIIIDGKKYMPTDGIDCGDCAFYCMECVAVCTLFSCSGFKEAKEDLNTKHGLEQIPVQVHPKE